MSGPLAHLNMPIKTVSVAFEFLKNFLLCAGQSGSGISTAGDLIVTVRNNHSFALCKSLTIRL